MSRKSAFSMVASVVWASLMLFVGPSVSAQDKSQAAATGQEAAFAEQDTRERKDALEFAEGRGLDLSKAVESDSGLWSLVIDEGEGPLATAGDTITAHCTGWLADGTKFWSSHDGQDEAMVNRVTGFVKGFTEGLQTMKAGGKSLLIFPGRMGYGPAGNPRAKIPPNATLVFEVELIGIQ